MKNETKIEKMIEDLAASVAKGFADQKDWFDKRFDEHDKKFKEHDKRFDGLEYDMTWVKDILEKQAGTLARLDQERLFTINHVNRLEAEIDKIKKQLKIA